MHDEKIGFGIAGFILGLLGSLSFLLPIICIPLSILGLVFSAIQIKRNKTKLAIAGLILSIIGLCLTILFIVIVLIA